MERKYIKATAKVQWEISFCISIDNNTTNQMIKEEVYQLIGGDDLEKQGCTIELEFDKNKVLTTQEHKSLLCDEILRNLNTTEEI